MQRWLDRAGVQAERTLPDQLVRVPQSGQLATDGLWARLRGGGKRAVLLLTDCVTGVLYPPVVVEDEATAAPWARLFARAQTAGLNRDAVRGVVSDGAAGLGAYLGAALWWVNHQRCVFHLWRNLRGELARQTTAAATGLVGAAAQAVQRRVRRDLVALVRATRELEGIELGASPRGSLALGRSAQALAALRGRSFVLPDDIKALAAPVLGHRLILTPEARMRGVTAGALLRDVLTDTPVPVEAI